MGLEEIEGIDHTIGIVDGDGTEGIEDLIGGIVDLDGIEDIEDTIDIVGLVGNEGMRRSFPD